MKKTLMIFILILALSTTVVSATSDRSLYGPNYTKAGSAYFINTSENAYMVLSVSSSPAATSELLDQLDWFCSAVDYMHLSDFIPGCDYVDFAEKFYKYVDKGMKANVRLTDATTGEFIWEDTLSDGAVLYLGNDHPNGYDIWISAKGLSYPWVQLIDAYNVDWR